MDESREITVIKIAAIVRDNATNPRDRIDGEIVTRYVELLDQMPPIEVYNVGQDLMLADGFHRVEAAIQRGWTEIRAHIRHGSRQDALEFAIRANARHGQPLTKDERRKAWRKLYELHPEWSLAQFAEALAMPRSTVDVWRDAEDVIAEVPEAENLPVGVLQEIKSTPKERWPALSSAASEKSWSRDEMRAAAHNVTDQSLPPEHMGALLRDEAEPIPHKEKNGLERPASLQQTIARKTEEAKDRDNQEALWRVLELINRTRAGWSPKALVDQLDVNELEHILRNLPDGVSYLDEVVREAKQAKGKLTVLPGGRTSRSRRSPGVKKRLKHQWRRREGRK